MEKKEKRKFGKKTFFKKYSPEFEMNGDFCEKRKITGIPENAIIVHIQENQSKLTDRKIRFEMN